MTALLSGLSQEQRAAVLAAEGPVLILAGAGSGKTRVITHRIAYLIQELAVPSEQVLAVTFTNKAAGEMKARVEALLAGPHRASISTFHSFCASLLRIEGEAVGVPRGFSIYDDDDQLAAVREALKALGLAEKLNPPRQVLSRISARKNLARETDEEDDETPLARISAAYQQTLKSAKALDFDDLLLKAAELVEGGSGVRERYQRRYRFIMVDEYQDTNRTQYRIVRALAGPEGNLTVVGDEDQSIYSWRGADLRNILDFEADFPGARVLRLEENYRSTQAILDAASALVAHNQLRKGKSLRAVQPGGRQVEVYRASEEFEEAERIVSQIAAQRSTGRSAILYRLNSQSRLFEEALLRRRMPYTIVGGVGFYERREVKDLLCYFRLILNPHDPVAFRRVLNVPARGIGPRTLETIEALARSGGLSLWDALAAAEEEAGLPARAALPLGRFRGMIEALREDARTHSVRALLARVLETTGYARALADDDSHESQDRLANLAELLSAAADYESRAPEPSLGGFLDQVALVSETDLLRDEAPVALMTLHAAKGLEFASVFLAGLEEGLVPHSRSLASAAGLEEERRLCYVGMTRAMERLHISWAESRQVYGMRRLTEASRFLSELPHDVVTISRSTHTTPPPTTLVRPPRLVERELPLPEVPAGLRPGVRVRHPLFGVGTVLRSDGEGEGLKLTVSFPGCGAKRLVARYAGLELL